MEERWATRNKKNALANLVARTSKNAVYGGEGLAHMQWPERTHLRDQRRCGSAEWGDADR